MLGSRLAFCARADIEYMQSDVIQIMIDPPPFSATTVIDNHGSVYAPHGGVGGRGGCSSLDGPKCLDIKEQYKDLSDEELGAIEDTQEEMMAALQDELQAALSQVRHGIWVCVLVTWVAFLSRRQRCCRDRLG